MLLEDPRLAQITAMDSGTILELDVTIRDEPLESHWRYTGRITVVRPRSRPEVVLEALKVVDVHTDRAVVVALDDPQRPDARSTARLAAERAAPCAHPSHRR